LRKIETELDGEAAAGMETLIVYITFNGKILNLILLLILQDLQKERIDISLWFSVL
jgi:hypothetical protein